MRVAVIGAGGFIGRCLVAHLGESGADVVPFSSQSSSMFEPASGILSNEFDLPAGTECVVYLAQSPYYRQMPEKASHMWGVNVLSAMKVAELARHRGVRRFIYASTGNVYSPSFSPLSEGDPLRRDDWYALSKIHAEEGLGLYRSDMSVTVTRIFGVYGPGQTDKLVPNLAQSIRSGVPIKLAPNPLDDKDEGGLKVSLCYIDDVVEIFSRLIFQAGSGVINVAGPEALSVRDIALSIGERLGVSPQFEVASQHRGFDLTADVTRLVETLNPVFTPFLNGITNVLKN